MLTRNLDQLDAGVDVVHRDDQQAGLRRARRAEQIQTGRVSVEDLEVELSQQLDLVGVVVEDGGAYT